MTVPRVLACREVSRFQMEAAQRQEQRLGMGPIRRVISRVPMFHKVPACPSRPTLIFLHQLLEADL